MFYPTLRQFETLCLIAKGKTNREIADIHFIGEKSVKITIRNLTKALGVKTRDELTTLARACDNISELFNHLQTSEKV